MGLGDRIDPTTALASGDPELSALIVAGQHRARVRRWEVVAIVVAAVVLLAWLVVPVIPLLIAPSQVQVCDSTFTASAHLSPLDPAKRLGRLGQTHALGVVPMTIWGSCNQGGPQRQVYVQLNSRTVVTYNDVQQG